MPRRQPRTAERIARQLVSARMEQGLTQQQAAATIGVSERTWRRWESGANVPEPRSWTLIRDRLGILLGSDENTAVQAELAQLRHGLETLRSKVGQRDARLASLERRLTLLERQPANGEDAG